MDDTDFHGFEDPISERLSTTPKQLNGRIENKVMTSKQKSKTKNINSRQNGNATDVLKNVNYENGVLMSKHNGLSEYSSGSEAMFNEDEENIENIEDGFLGFDNDHRGSSWLGWETFSSVKLEQLTKLVEKKQNYGNNLNRIVSQSTNHNPDAIEIKQLKLKDCSVNLTRLM